MTARNKNGIITARRQNDFSSVHLETLYHQAQKLEQRHENLLTAYTDPDIAMTKKDYLKQKGAIDGELTEVAEKTEKTESELAEIKTPADLESFAAFTFAIRDELDNGKELTPQEKRVYYEMLHLRVIIKRDGGIDIAGWHSKDGLSDTTSLRCGRKAVTFVLHITAAEFRGKT